MRSDPSSTTQTTDSESAAHPKVLVRRLIQEVMNEGNLNALDQIFSSSMATEARAWIEPFRASFPDVQMDIVTLVAEGDTVVGRFTCSATHLGPWEDNPPTGRRFHNVDEVYFFTVVGGRITASWGLEDTRSRLEQLGLSTG